MIVFGICGSSGAGKSSICSCFAQNGVPVLDCDCIYKELTSRRSPCLQELEAAFGQEIISGESLNRKKMAEIAFSDDKKHRLLNSISHRFVKAELAKRIKALKDNHISACVIDAPLLFEAGLEKECDCVIGVVADQRMQLRRIVSRDGITPQDAEMRLKSQMPEEFLREHCDVILENNSSLDLLYRQVRELLNRYGL